MANDHSAPPSRSTDLILRPLAQFEGGEDWRLATLHDRPEYLMIWITKGQGLAVLSGKRLGIGAHSALLIPPETLFSLDLLRGAGGLVLSMKATTADSLSMPRFAEVLRLRDVQSQAEMTHRLEAIHREASQSAPHAQDALNAHGALLSVALRRFMAAHDLPLPRSAPQRLADAFCAMVAKHYADGLNLSDYAQMLGVTLPHLTRSCKEACGLTAVDILSARSLYAARQLVEHSSMPLKQIANELGFGSAAYFSRFVQKQTGKSPSALRKASRSPRASASGSAKPAVTSIPR